METVDLHAQKVTILSRLIKESSLTLEEALLLLKEEENSKPVSIPQTSTGTWTTTPYTVTYPTFLSGIPNTGTLTTSSSSSSFTNTIADSSADLNN